jgi:hypothetical protein
LRITFIFLQEANQKMYFKYNLGTNMDSNTYIDAQCINGNDTIPTQWRRYQDGVGLGGDAPSFNLFDDNNEFACNRINQWFIGQSAIGTPNKAIVAGGYAVAGDGELHRSRAWWESPTFGVTFKWNVDVIQPEDTSNINYKYRTLSPFWSNGDNSGAQATLGVTVFDVAGSTNRAGRPRERVNRTPVVGGRHRDQRIAAVFVFRGPGGRFDRGAQPPVATHPPGPRALGHR